MNSTPLHPMIVHFPLALGLILPVLAIIFAIMIRKGKFTTSTWLVIAGLQLLTMTTGYLAMATGEREESIVERVAGKPPIHEHETRAEMFVAGTVAASALAVISYFIRPGIQFYVQLATVLVMLVNSFLVLRTGEAGGELVYRYGAPNAYIAAKSVPVEEAAAAGLLPTPGQNTSESPMPVDDADGSHEGDEADEDEDHEPEETPAN